MKLYITFVQLLHLQRYEKDKTQSILKLIQMTEMIFLPKDDVILAIQEAVESKFNEIEKSRKRIETPKLFTINYIAKRLGRSHATITKLCENGTIRTTPDGRIEESEIERYLSNT